MMVLGHISKTSKTAGYGRILPYQALPRCKCEVGHRGGEAGVTDRKTAGRANVSRSDTRS
jgi:hypothetical protein